jgi:hypothetical protein
MDRPSARSPAAALFFIPRAVQLRPDNQFDADPWPSAFARMSRLNETMRFLRKKKNPFVEMVDRCTRTTPQSIGKIS